MVVTAEVRIFLSTAQVSGKEKNQKNEQDEAEPTSAYHGPTKIKSTTAEQEHQNN